MGIMWAMTNYFESFDIHESSWSTRGRLFLFFDRLFRLTSSDTKTAICLVLIVIFFCRVSLMIYSCLPIPYYFVVVGSFIMALFITIYLVFWASVHCLIH